VHVKTLVAQEQRMLLTSRKLLQRKLVDLELDLRGGAHVGLTPKRYQSGEIDYDGGVSKCGDALLRTMLYEAANSLLIHSGRWSWLKAWGMRVAQRRGIRRAIVAVARRLAVVLHRMWVDGSEFRWSKNSAAVPGFV
jgi:transposase